MKLKGFCAILLLGRFRSLNAEVASVFFQGAKIDGGVEGMYFDADNNLYVTQLLGRSIRKINPETGEILGGLGESDGVYFPDDVVISSNGTVFWSENVYATYYAKSPDGDSYPLLPPGTIPSANSLTLSDDETRIFFGQCWDTRNPNSIYQLDLVTNELTTIVEGIHGCAANAFDFMDEALYIPRPFEGRVVKLNLTTGEETNVTSGWGIPNAVKLDSKRENLYALNVGLGEIARISLANFTTADTENNREIVAKLPAAGRNDNIALDKDDRLYVSSNVEGAVLEVLLNDDDLTNFRTVSPGQMGKGMGLALLGDVLYTLNPLALYGIDINTGEFLSLLPSIPEIGALFVPTSLATWKNNIVHMSIISGLLSVLDMSMEQNLIVSFFGEPLDAFPVPGTDDELLVTDVSGTLVRASGPQLENREIVANITGIRFLAGNDNGDIYATVASPNDDAGAGRVVQVMSNGTVLDPLVEIATGFVNPEGLDFCSPKQLLVVTNANGGSLESIDLETGTVRNVTSDMEFFGPIPGFSFGFVNDVLAVQDGNGGCVAYLNSERPNAILKVSVNAPDDDAEKDTDGNGDTSNGGFLKPAVTMMTGIALSIGIALII